MTFTAVLSADIALPEETWLHARVRKHGRELEVAAEGDVAVSTESTRAEALHAWLQRCAEQPACRFSDADFDDLRWQGLQDKYGL